MAAGPRDPSRPQATAQESERIQEQEGKKSRGKGGGERIDKTKTQEAYFIQSKGQCNSKAHSYSNQMSQQVLRQGGRDTYM